jgi:polar amino acid transport system substrate-binding protein
VNPPAEPVVRLVADPYPPYQRTGDSGAVEGLDQELVVAAFAAVGLWARTELLPWSACMRAVAEGEADAIFQITPTAEREAWMAFSAPFREARSLLYRRRGEGPDNLGGGLADLERGLILGCLSGFSYGAALDAVGGKLEFTSDAELLDALRAGELDLAVVDEGVAASLLGDSDDIEAVAGFAATRPLHLGAHRDREWAVTAFNRGLETIGTAARG